MINRAEKVYDVNLRERTILSFTYFLELIRDNILGFQRILVGYRGLSLKTFLIGSKMLAQYRFTEMMRDFSCVISNPCS
jgi:hypothetical protein